MKLFGIIVVVCKKVRFKLGNFLNKCIMGFKDIKNGFINFINVLVNGGEVNDDTVILDGDLENALKKLKREEERFTKLEISTIDLEKDNFGPLNSNMSAPEKKCAELGLRSETMKIISDTGIKNTSVNDLPKFERAKGGIDRTIIK